MKHAHWVRRLTAGLLASLCLLAAGCGSGDADMRGWEKYSAYWFDVFDTVTILTGYAPSQEEWDKQAEAMHEDLLYYHKLFDIYNTYEGVNNLATVNAAAGQEPVAVDEPVLDMLEMALEGYEKTGGKMNVAAGSMLSIWHDYRTAGLDDPDNAALPPMDQLEAAMAHTDPANVQIDREAGTVYLADPDMRLDVGSVGKGYAVEQVARAAEERGLTSFLLSVGGNLRGVGHKPDGAAWTGGIENPWTEYFAGESYVQVVNVEDAALVTSGDYQRYYTVDGVNYHHLIDMDTLMPARYFDAVAVYTDDSGWADCLSTGLFCMDLEDGQALVESLDNVEAMWMLTDGTIVYSEGFEAHLRQS